MIKKVISCFKNYSYLKKILILLFISFIASITFNAWLCDDAYISFRTINNFLNGFGLTWNTFERVQTYSNPLMVLLLSGISFFTGELYYTTIFFSIIVSSVAVYILLFKICKNEKIAIMISIWLLLSRSFIFYSTSGLENCLTFLILAIFFHQFFKNETFNKWGLFKISLTGAFLLLNRMDSILLILPALFYIFFYKRNKDVSFASAFLIGLAGLIPFIMWGVFTFIYYGDLVPNTAHAKLAKGISKLVYIKKGLLYLFSVFLQDVFTIIPIILATIFIFISKNKKAIIASIGIFLSILYIIYVGGDFMLGRFLTPALFTAMILLAGLKIDDSLFKKITPLFIVCTALFFAMTHFFVNNVYEQRNDFIKYYWGTYDDSAVYFSSTALFGRRTLDDEHTSTKKQWLEVHNTNPILIDSEGIGFIGYYAGPNIRIIDPFSLGDPLLSRLHMNLKWIDHIAHLKREIPEGYYETVATGQNLIESEPLAKYYEKTKIITQGKIFTKERFKTIINRMLGKYDYLIIEYHNEVKK